MGGIWVDMAVAKRKVSVRDMKCGAYEAARGIGAAFDARGSR
jgi:hypothetical protein